MAFIVAIFDFGSDPNFMISDLASRPFKCLKEISLVVLKKK